MSLGQIKKTRLSQRLHNTLMNTNKNILSAWVALAAFLGLCAVSLGAIAAHALSDPKAIAAIEKAALYQMIHAVVLLIACQWDGRVAQLSRWLLFIGIVLFSGSIELKYLLGVTQATVVAPTGGICLMLGWISLGIAGYRQQKTSSA